MSDVMQDLSPAVRQKIQEMGRSRATALSLRDNNWFGDAVGSLVVGASYLLGGAPGSRKSGLATQIALDLARQGKRVLIVPTEEPADRVWERMLKMMDGFDASDINTTMTNLIVERNPPSVEQLPNYVSSQVLSPSGSYHGITLAVLDSVQGHGLVSAATRAYDRVLEATRLFTLKNRHGPASLRDPVALVLDPITLRLIPTPLALALHAAAKTYVGAGAGGAIDVQASVALAGYGTRGKVLAPGLPKAELQQLVATIGQLPGIEIDDLDFSIHCRLPGRRRYTSSVGLALAMSLLSSYLRRPIPANCLFLGEVDLGRGIRPIDDRLLNELIADIAAGAEVSGPWKIYCHPQTAFWQLGDGITSIACEKLETVMYGVWPELR